MDEQTKLELWLAIQQLLDETLHTEGIQKLHKNGPQGSHFPCIIGHYRAYQNVGLSYCDFINTLSLTTSPTRLLT